MNTRQRSPFARTKQCAGCPWKTGTNPHRDITNYDPKKHQRLMSCTSKSLLETSIMACHESKEGKEFACVGWLVHQLGPGNNIALRIMALNKKLGELKIEGPQHESLEEMCAASFQEE